MDFGSHVVGGAVLVVLVAGRFQIGFGQSHLGDGNRQRLRSRFRFEFIQKGQGGFRLRLQLLRGGSLHRIVNGEQRSAGRHLLAFAHQHLGDRAGNFRKDIDVFTARLLALDNAVGIDGRVVRVADRFEHGGLGLPLHAHDVGGDQCCQDTQYREGKDDLVSEFRFGLGGFGVGCRLGGFGFGLRLGFVLGSG
jgi:hypothetical protein